MVFRELKEKKRKRLLSLWFSFWLHEKKNFKEKKNKKGNLFMVFRELKKKREKAFVPLVFLVTREKKFKEKNTKGKKHIRPCGFPFG